MHLWGEEDVDWAGIDDAAAFIGEGLRWWRVDVRQYKEKFGTVRVYCTLGVTSLHQLTHPGHVYRRWKSGWWWKQDCCAGWVKRLLTVVNWVAVPLHKALYRWYYRRARARWPHLAQEISRGADFPELLGAKLKVTHPSGGGIIWWPEWDEEPVSDAKS
jgi:hypothetical protein